MPATLAASTSACEARFRAMGSDVHIVAIGAHRSDLDRAQERLHDLELLWSRFIEHSEISQLNRSAGPMVVSPETFRLIELAIVGWERTAGRFDPTVHDALIAAGYDDWSKRSHDHGTRSTIAAVVGEAPVPGCAGVRLDRHALTVELPVGVRVDPGGIGKGLAADIVSSELITAGADGALVNLGGDLRARGVSPDQGGWLIDVYEPKVADGVVSRLCVLEGAVATSTTEKRCWNAEHANTDATMHHLVDPVSGRPYDRSIRMATTITRDAWWAEVSTKQLFGMPRRSDSNSDMTADINNVLVDAAGLVITADGRIHRSANFPDFER